MNLAKKRTALLAASPASGFGVDPATGTLSNVAFLTVGLTVDERFYIDAQTLVTALAAINSHGGQLKVYPTHTHSGWPNFWKEREPDDAASELNFAAFAGDLAIKGEQLVGPKLEFYDTFKKNYAPQYEQIVELAAKTPNLLGLSLEPVFHLVYVDKKGIEYQSRPENTDLAYEGMPAMRVDKLYTAAFGSVVAANPGLFAQLTAKFGGKRMKKLAKQIAAELQASPPPAAAASLLSKTEEKPPVVSSPAISKDPSKDSQTMQLITDLKAKFGSDEKKFAQAMLIVGRKPDVTLAAVEAEMVHADLTAAVGQVATLTTDLATAKTQVATLTTERDTAKTEAADWKKKFETVKASGLAAGLNLGADSTGAGGAEENPFLTENMTAQCEIMQRDPAKAEALRVAAAAQRSAAAKPAPAKT